MLRKAMLFFQATPKCIRLGVLTGLIVALLTGCSLAPDETEAVPKAPENFLGVVPQDELTHADTARMHKGRVKHLRLAISWAMVQPSPGRVDYNYLDQLIRYAAVERIRVLPTLYGTPPWMSKEWTRLPVQNSSQLKRWRTFVRGMVERYGIGGDFWSEPAQVEGKVPRIPVTEWQIWNEVNFHYFATPVSPGQYGRLLNASADVIRSVNGKANIVLAGLYARPKGPPSMARHADVYLRQLMRFVPKRNFDVLAIHPYAPDTTSLRYIMRSFRSTARKAGLGSKPIYIDEIGWGSGRSTNAFLLGNEWAQARQVKAALNYLVNNRRQLNLQRVYWFAWQDLPRSVETCSFCYSIGLFKWRAGNRLIAKPAWRNFVKFTRGHP